MVERIFHSDDLISILTRWALVALLLLGHLAYSFKAEAAIITPVNTAYLIPQ